MNILNIVNLSLRHSGVTAAKHPSELNITIFVHYKKSSGNNLDDTLPLDFMKNDIKYGQGHRYLFPRFHGSRYPILKINIFLLLYHNKKFDIVKHLGGKASMLITTPLPLTIHISNQSVNLPPYEHQPSTMNTMNLSPYNRTYHNKNNCLLHHHGHIPHTLIPFTIPRLQHTRLIHTVSIPIIIHRHKDIRRILTVHILLLRYR